MQQNKRQLHTRALVQTMQGLEEKAVVTLSSLLILAAFAYVYFVGAAVVHAVVSKETQTRTAQAHSEVAELEVVYLSQKNRATQDLAEELGLVRVQHKHFAQRHTALGLAALTTTDN